MHFKFVMRVDTKMLGNRLRSELDVVFLEVFNNTIFVERKAVSYILPKGDDVFFLEILDAWIVSCIAGVCH